MPQRCASLPEGQGERREAGSRKISVRKFIRDSMLFVRFLWNEKTNLLVYERFNILCISRSDSLRLIVSLLSIFPFPFARAIAILILFFLP